MIILLVFFFITHSYNKPLNPWKDGSDGHSIARHIFAPHHRAARNHVHLRKYERIRNNTGRTDKRTFEIKSLSKNTRMKMGQTKNVKLLKLLMMYALGEITKRSKYEISLNRTQGRDLRRSYIRMRDKISKFARLLNDMEWNDTLNSNDTQSKDDNYNSRPKGNFSMSPVKFNSILKSLGSDEWWKPGNKNTAEHGKKSTAVYSGTVVANTRGDTDYDFLTSQNSGSPNGKGSVMPNSRSETDAYTSMSGENQVAEILHKIKNMFGTNDTQSKGHISSTQKDDYDVGPANFDNIMESLGSESVSERESKSEEQHENENTTIYNRTVENTRGNIDYTLPTPQKVDSAKVDNIEIMNPIPDSEEDEVADILKTLTERNKQTNSSNSSNVRNITKSSDTSTVDSIANSSNSNSNVTQIINGHNDSNDNSSIPVSFKLTNHIPSTTSDIAQRTNGQNDSNDNSSTISDIAQRTNGQNDSNHNSSTTSDVAQIINGHESNNNSSISSDVVQRRNGHNDSIDNSSIPVPSNLTNQTTHNVQMLGNSTKRSKDIIHSKNVSKDDDIGSILATLLNTGNQTHVYGTDEANNNTAANKNNKQIQLSIILKYERLLKLLHSKLTSGDDWKQNTFLNISVSKFEKLLDSLTTELTEDLEKEKGKGKHNNNGKHSKATGTRKVHMGPPVSDIFLNISYSDDEEKPTVKHNVEVPPISDPPQTNMSDFKDKAHYISKLVENTKLFHSSTMKKFYKLLQEISFKNLIQGLPHMRVDNGINKHVDYYSFGDRFVKRMDHLMRLLAFNRIFDDVSPRMRADGDAKKLENMDVHKTSEKTDEALDDSAGRSSEGRKL